MKPLLLLLFLPLMSMAQKPGISEEMATFLESCRLLQEGIDNRDKYLVTDAAEGFNEIETEELSPEDFSISESGLRFISLPEVQYNYLFCREVRKNDFVLVEREPLQQVRGGLPGNESLNTISRAILPGGEATFLIEWADDEPIELAVPSSASDALKVNVTANGRPIEGNIHNGFFYTSENLSEGEIISVTISNPTEEKISFCIALK